MAYLRCLVPLLLVLGARPAPARGQDLFLGLSAGGAALPGVFGHDCSGECSDVLPAAGVEAHLGISAGSLGIELRGSSWGEAVFLDNYGTRGPRPVHESGVHQDVTYPFRKGSLGTVDLRIRYAGLSDLPILLAAGGGVAAGEMPYVLGSAGVRFGRGVKGLLELEWMNFRVPAETVTREWREFSVIRTLHTERSHSWKAGAAVRIGVELTPFS